MSPFAEREATLVDFQILTQILSALGRVACVIYQHRQVRDSIAQGVSALGRVVYERNQPQPGRDSCGVAIIVFLADVTRHRESHPVGADYRVTGR